MFVTFSASLSVIVIVVSLQGCFASNSNNECNKALGLQNGKVQDSQLSSSSHYEFFYIGGGRSVQSGPKCARLNHDCAWCAASKGSYIQLDLIQNTTINGIATQGLSGVNDYFVSRYRVVFSIDRVNWTNSLVFTGNSDAQTTVKHTFPEPLIARYLRVYPVSYRYRVCMRMELYGCMNLPTASKPQNGNTTLTTVRPSSSEAIASSHHPAVTVSTASPKQRFTTTAKPSPKQRNTSHHSVTEGQSASPASTIPPLTQATNSRNSDSGMAKPLSPMNSSITNDSLSLSTKGMTTEAEIDAPVGEHDSGDLFDNLTVGSIVGVAILLICVLPSVMVLVFICHRRQKRSQDNSIMMYGIPLTTAVVDMGLYNQEVDEHNISKEKWMDSDSLLSVCAV